MATIQYARLYPDTTQLQAKDGHNLTAGWVEVYLAGTDDPAVTYADFNGTRNPQRIVVDDNGRFCAIVDKSKAYRVEVYDADGMLQWTTEPVWCTGNAGAGMSVTRVVSTDGSIAVEENINGSERTYDISIAPSDSDEFLEWIKCSEEDCGSTWHPVYQAGTMETEAGQGIKVHGGHLYHFTNTFYVDPNGTGINYDTFKVLMYCNDEIVDVRDFDIDSSLNDAVMCEFSTDLIPEIDGVVYYKLTIPSTCEVTAEVQCHRIYSGINAVPDTCATKQWVQETFDYNMAEKISYSALEYNGNGDISGISGSAIAGGLDSAAVSSIASSYAESAISSISGWSGDFSSISSKIDWSSSGVFQPSGDYAFNSSLSSKADQSAFEQCCDEVHSALDDKLDKSASGEFQPSGQYVYESAYSSFSSEVTNNISSLSSNVSSISADMSSYVPFSGLEGEGGKVTGISGSAFKGHEYTGISPVTVDNTADTISVEHRSLCVDSTMTAYNSGSSAVIGVNVAGLDLSSKMDASASSLFYSTSNPSGFITGVDLTPYQLTADMSAYAHESSLSSKLDASASSDFMSTSERADYLPASASADLFTGVHTDSSLTGNGLSSSPLGVERVDVKFASGLATGISGDSVVVSADADYFSSYATTSYVDESVSSKLDASASSEFYPSSNPSGFLTAHQSLAGYATESYVDSAVSGKLDVTASSQFLTSLPDDLAYTSDVASAVSGKMDKSESSSFYPMDSNPSGYLTAHQSLAGYATVEYVDSAVSGKLDATAYDSAEFYSTSNPSGFIGAASASAIASAYQVVSATATQLNAGTAYLTSVNDTPISASRAGNAANASLANSAWYDGTGRFISSLPDAATVSSIASAYAESAASSKMDSDEMSAYVPFSAISADENSAITSINGSSVGGGITGDYLTSKVGSGQATLSTALQDGMDKRPALVISAQRSAGSSMYPRMMVTDWNNTTGDTHSGMLLANAFEFYRCPTSAKGEVDPSGFVEARLDPNKFEMVVNDGVSSKTRSALYSRSGLELGYSGDSASWVKVTGEDYYGGLITLNNRNGIHGVIYPSSIGYWNGKLDGSASSSFYTTANESAYVDSAYVDSAVSGKQDTLNFEYNEDSAISSINGSALAGGGAQVVTSITTGGYGVREINGMVINASHMVLGAEAASNTSNVVKLGNSDYGAGVFLTGQFGSAYYKVNELQLNRNGTGFIGFNIGGAGSQITATSNAGGKFSAGGTGGNRSYYTAFNASASASIEVTGGTAMVNITDAAYTSTIYPSSIPYWNAKLDSAEMSAYVAKSAYDDLYSAFTALSGIISTYSGYFSSISAKVDNSAIGVIE